METILFSVQRMLINRLFECQICHVEFIHENRAELPVHLPATIAMAHVVCVLPDLPAQTMVYRHHISALLMGSPEVIVCSVFDAPFGNLKRVVSMVIGYMPELVGQYTHLGIEGKRAQQDRIKVSAYRIIE